MLILDKENCSKCGICSAICPLRVITIDSNGYPAIPEPNKPRCISCGHCVAICNDKAISLETVSLKECSEFDDKHEYFNVNLEEFFNKRRSIRHYKKQPVEKQKVERLLSLSTYAPTGRNAQCLSWIVINNQNRIDKLVDMTIDWMKKELEGNSFLTDYYIGLIKSREKGNDPILRGAPTIIIATSEKKHGVAVEDGATAISYIELAASQTGLGSCWAGFLYYAIKSDLKLQQFLDISEDQLCVGALMLGYPKYKYYRSPPRNKPSITWR